MLSSHRSAPSVGEYRMRMEWEWRRAIADPDTTWFEPGKSTRRPEPPLLSTCNTGWEPIDSNVIGCASFPLPCRQLGRDQTRYQVQAESTLAWDSGTCQPVAGSS